MVEVVIVCGEIARIGTRGAYREILGYTDGIIRIISNYNSFSVPFRMALQTSSVSILDIKILDIHIDMHTTAARLSKTFSRDRNTVFW